MQLLAPGSWQERGEAKASSQQANSQYGLVVKIWEYYSTNWYTAIAPHSHPPLLFARVAQLHSQVPLMPPATKSLTFMGPGLNPCLYIVKIIPGWSLLTLVGIGILRASSGTDRKDDLRKHSAYSSPPELNSSGAAYTHPPPLTSPILLTNLVFDSLSDSLIFLSVRSPSNWLIPNLMSRFLPGGRSTPPCSHVRCQLLCCNHQRPSGTSEAQCFLPLFYLTV